MYPIYVRRIRFKVDSPERTIRPIIFCYARQLGTIDFVDTHIYNVVKDHLLVNENDSSLVDIMQVTELSNTILTINNEEELNSYFNNKKGVNGMVAYFQSSFITENLPQSLYYKLPKRIEINTADFGFVDLPIFPHN